LPVVAIAGTTCRPLQTQVMSLLCKTQTSQLTLGGLIASAFQSLFECWFITYQYTAKDEELLHASMMSPHQGLFVCNMSHKLVSKKNLLDPSILLLDMSTRGTTMIFWRLSVTWSYYNHADAGLKCTYLRVYSYAKSRRSAKYTLNISTFLHDRMHVWVDVCVYMFTCACMRDDLPVTTDPVARPSLTCKSDIPSPPISPARTRCIVYTIHKYTCMYRMSEYVHNMILLNS